MPCNWNSEVLLALRKGWQLAGGMYFHFRVTRLWSSYSEETLLLGNCMSGNLQESFCLK